VGWERFRVTTIVDGFIISETARFGNREYRRTLNLWEYFELNQDGSVTRYSMGLTSLFPPAFGWVATPAGADFEFRTLCHYLSEIPPADQFTYTAGVFALEDIGSFVSLELIFWQGGEFIIRGSRLGGGVLSAIEIHVSYLMPEMPVLQ
jgi:hypothetical protein